MQCKDIDLKAELYGNRADAHLRLGEAMFVLKKGRQGSRVVNPSG